VPLEILEPRHQLAVQRHAQLVEPREQPLFGVERGLGQPGDEIAAHFGRQLFLRAATDTRSPQRTAGMQVPATFAQLFQQTGVDEIVDYAEAARRQLIDQRIDGPVYRARRRGRSPRRLACGRRVLALALGFGLRRFGCGLFAGHNMVPRHFGEPQRQA